MPTADAPDKGYIGKSEYIIITGPFVGLYSWIKFKLSVCASVPNVDLPPLCSSRFRPGPPGEQAQVASQFIADVINEWEKLTCISRVV